jgi:hypothetical protein
MKTFLTIAAVTAAVATAGCDMLGSAGQAAVRVSARIGDIASRAVASGDTLTTVDGYTVVFKKVEIGNSEADKFTLWESSSPDGQAMDIVSEVSFEGVSTIREGTYNYVRFTIGKTLTVEGSIVDGATTYSGVGSETLAEEAYLFGVDLPNGLGEATVTQAIEIVDGAELAIVFDVAGTVSYVGGPADAAVLSVEKPVVTVIVE